MNQLSKEAIELCQEKAMHIFNITSEYVTESRIKDLMLSSMTECLQDITIVKAANLVSKDDALGFIEWAENNYGYFPTLGWINLSEDSPFLTTKELYELYQRKGS